MELNKVIESRRSYRALEKIDITEKMIEELVTASSLAPSCYNNQPWKFVFIKDLNKLNQLFEAYSKGNEWCQQASLVIAVISKKDDDCVIGNRSYYQFDTGMATAFLLLKAVDMGLVAHPIAGFNPEKVSKIIELAEGYEIITLIIVGKKSENLKNLTKPWQIESEKSRPERKKLKEYCFIDKFEQ